MYGGLLKSASAVAIFAAAGLYGASPAKAADLGGDCCADLEERVAELEATTVRKGNRKVSLQISGYVSHHVMYWDDGVRSDTYIGDGGNYGSRWRFTGSAKISPQLTAGFLYEYGISENQINSVDQEHRAAACSLTAGAVVPANCATTARPNGDDQAGTTFALRDTTVWLRHSQLGMVKVGHGSTATDNLVLIDVANLGGASTPDVALYGGGMRMAHTAAAEAYSRFTWQDMIRGHESWDANRRNHVLYETPSLAGFTLQAAVAEDNFWDVALRYAGEFGGFRIAGGIGYSEDTEFNTRSASNAFAGAVVTCQAGCNTKSTDLKGSLSVMHVQTGLFVTAAAGTREMENLQRLNAADGAIANLGNRDGSFWHIAAGISQNFFGIGRTTLYGEYGNHQDMLTMIRETVTSSDATNWGIGINQTVDAAAMDIFLAYKHFEGDYTSSVAETAANGGAIIGRNSVRDLNMVILGTRVNF